jgi:hypothetical protein
MQSKRISANDQETAACPRTSVRECLSSYCQTHKHVRMPGPYLSICAGTSQALAGLPLSPFLMILCPERHRRFIENTGFLEADGLST